MVKRSGATTIEVISIFEVFFEVVFHSKEYSGHLPFEKHEVVGGGGGVMFFLPIIIPHQHKLF